MILKIKKIAFLLKIMICLFITQVGFAQFDIPEIPKFQTSVYDYANVLSLSEKSQLEEKLIKYSDSTTTQIVIITIESLKGEDIGILTPKWLQDWGIGDKKKDNGVLILLAKTERKIWISPGYGLEDRLTAGVNGQIIRNSIIPEFKTGNYFNGLNKGLDEIFKVFTGKYKGTRQETSLNEPFPIGLIFIIIIIVLVIISKSSKGGNSGFGRTPSLLDIIILSNSGRSGGFGGGDFGGSSGGGGFGGGFGGGGSSGGGAGGSW
jgi:uncharacterized protein